MEFDKESRIAEIMARRIAGTTDAGERETLNRWLAESEDNRRLLDKLIAEMQGDGMDGHFDAHRGERCIDRKILLRRRRRTVARIASVAAVLLLGVFSAYLFTGRDPVAVVKTSETVSPGSAMAVLSYGDEHVVLTGEDQDGGWRRHIYREDENPGMKISVEVHYGGEYKIRLDDGTLVWLNSGSRIEYPESFGSGEREVTFTGEAYFEVVKDPAKPFTVDASGTRIRVLGTSFNVSAYPDDAQTVTTLVSGTVEVSGGGHSATLSPGQQAVVNNGGIRVNVVDTSLYTSWTGGFFEFENMELRDICKRLSRWYNVEFVFEGDSAYERFTGGTWKYVPLGEFLEKIERVTNVAFEYEDDRVVVIPGR